MTAGMQAGGLLREARMRAGLSQLELARRAGVTQSVISAYETGGRKPALPTLTRLIAATGCELDLRLRTPAGAGRHALRGPLGRRVREHRDDLLAVAGRHGVTDVRLFGSVARGEDTADSDVDLLVDVPPGMGLLGLARLQQELEALLDASVDLVPAQDVKQAVREDVLADAMQL